jgi:hypothetical protein
VQQPMFLALPAESGRLQVHPHIPQSRRLTASGLVSLVLEQVRPVANRRALDFHQPQGMAPSLSTQVPVGPVIVLRHRKIRHFQLVTRGSHFKGISM